MTLHIVDRKKGSTYTAC